MADPVHKYLSQVEDLSNSSGATIYDIVAKGFENQKTIQLTGDVTGSGTSDFLATTLQIALAIEDGKVTESKLGTGAVTEGKLHDGAVTFPKFAASTIGDVATGSATKIPTASSVKNYVDSAVHGVGGYKGKQTVATINSWTAAMLRNSDRVIVTGISVEHPENTINLGPGHEPFTVRNGEDLIFWKEDGVAASGIWDSMDSEFKLRQNAKLSPDTDPTNTAVAFIDTISQDENGEITATKKAIPEANQQYAGLMSSADKTKLDNLYNRSDLDTKLNAKADKVNNANAGNFAGLDANGNLVDSGHKHSDYASAEQGLKADSAIQGVFLNGSELNKDSANKVNLGNLKVKQTAVSVDGSTSKTITNISQNEDGVVTPTFAEIQRATTTQDGLMTKEQVALLGAAEPNFDILYNPENKSLGFTKAFGLVSA